METGVNLKDFLNSKWKLEILRFMLSKLEKFLVSEMKTGNFTISIP